MKIEKNYERYQGLHDLTYEHDFGVLKNNLGSYGGIESEYASYDDYQDETIQ